MTVPWIVDIGPGITMALARRAALHTRYLGLCSPNSYSLLLYLCIKPFHEMRGLGAFHGADQMRRASVNRHYII